MKRKQMEEEKKKRKEEEVLAKQLEEELMEKELVDKVEQEVRLKDSRIEPIIPTLNIRHPTPIIGGHLPINEIVITFQEEVWILDISNFTFDHFKFKINLERRKYYSNEPNKPISVILEREIVTDTRINPITITFAGITS